MRMSGIKTLVHLNGDKFRSHSAEAPGIQVHNGLDGKGGMASSQAPPPSSHVQERVSRSQSRPESSSLPTSLLLATAKSRVNNCKVHVRFLAQYPRFRQPTTNSTSVRHNLL